MKRGTLTGILIVFSILLAAQDIGGDYYVAPPDHPDTPGNDMTGDGTYENPWATWQKAFNVAQSGDTVYIRGGIYYSEEAQVIDPLNGKGHNGTHDAPVCFFNYPGEIPVLDCRHHCDDFTGYNQGINIVKAEHIHFKGLQIRNVFLCAENKVSGAVSGTYSSNLTFENMTIYQIGQRGFHWLDPGAWNPWDSPEPAFEYDTTRWINCDVFNVCDTFVNNPGNAGDGWKCHTYEGNYFSWEGCRAWSYSDDGFDMSGQGTRVFNNCWAMPTNNYSEFEIEGNGFKVGAVNPEFINVNSENNFVRMSNCIAIFGSGTGFYDLDYNPYQTTHALYYNNTAYHMGIGYRSNTEDGQVESTIWRNNISYKSTDISPGGASYSVAIKDGDGMYTESNNTWDAYNPLPGSAPWFVTTDTVTVTDDDFLQTDSLTLISIFTAPRQPDWSLPATKPLSLAEGSDLIDAGIDVGLPYIGVAPDIGAYEFGSGGNKYPTVSISSPSGETTYEDPGEITIEARAEDSDGEVVLVEFYANTSKLGEDATSPFTYTWTNPPYGNYFLRAVATDDQDAKNSSANILVRIRAEGAEADCYISPNPNDGKFTLFLAEPLDVTTEVTINSLDGKYSYISMIPENAATQEFDISNLDTGYYVLTLTDSQGCSPRRFIKF